MELRSDMAAPSRFSRELANSLIAVIQQRESARLEKERMRVQAYRSELHDAREKLNEAMNEFEQSKQCLSSFGVSYYCDEIKSEIDRITYAPRLAAKRLDELITELKNLVASVRGTRSW